MTTNHTGNVVPGGHSRHLLHEWEMVAAFALVLDKEKSSKEKCMLEPVARSLMAYGMEEPLLREICAEVERVGEELRTCCPEGKLGCIIVRVQMAERTLHNKGPWQYFLIKQIESSESDNLEALENPICIIDLHVYKGE